VHWANKLGNKTRRSSLPWNKFVGVLAFRAFPSLPTRLGGAARFLAAAASPFSTDAAASVDLRARETVGLVHTA